MVSEDTEKIYKNCFDEEFIATDRKVRNGDPVLNNLPCFITC